MRTQLLEFIDELINNMAKGAQTDIQNLDFSKAFDRVNHSLLVHKLYHYGVRGTLNRWISDFLRDRKQAVVINGAKSDFINVESGVPQGSVLGPCLFLVYINDLPNRLTPSARLFADDTAVYSIVSSTEDQTRLQQDLNPLSEWEESWEMAFHPEKSTTLAVTRNRHVLRHQYRLHGRDLELLVTSARYLGGDCEWGCHLG
jgi:ribonucleases P/MRP protein subunit RPP40